MAEVQTTDSKAVLSLQARLEQLEAAILEGQTIIGRITGTTQAEGVDVACGAVACADRCIQEMQNLNRELTAVADTVGQT